MPEKQRHKNTHRTIPKKLFTKTGHSLVIIKWIGPLIAPQRYQEIQKYDEKHFLID